MKEVYKKTSLVGFISGIGTTVFGIFYYFYNYESFSENGLLLIEIGLVALGAVGTGIYFKSAHEKLKDVPLHSEESDIDIGRLRELNIQWVPSPFPKMYNVDADGNPIFKIEPSKQKPIARKLTFFSLFSNGFIIPATYDILDMQDDLLASFTNWTNGNRYVLTLYDANGEKIGHFEQRLTQSKLKNRGTLFYADGAVWRELEAKNTAGDIDIKGEDGDTSATYRYGRFPYALKPAFQAEALHSHVRFGSQASEDEKLAYTMIFFFWLKN